MRMNVNLYTEEIKQYIKEVQNCRGRNPEKLLAACDKLESYGRDFSDDALIGFACFSRGETYYLLNDMANFYEQMLACIAPLERIQEWGYVIMANNLLGIMSLNRGNAPFAMDYYMKALQYCHMYKLPDLEWMVHMNIGALYLNIEEGQKAMEHMEKAYQYIKRDTSHPEYKQNILSVYLGMAKAYIHMGSITTAEKYRKKINKECMENLTCLDQMVIACFDARYYQETKEEARFHKAVMQIKESMQCNIPMLDVFDDLYDFMKMLLKQGCYSDFYQVYPLMEGMVSKMGIKNLEKKLVTLKVFYMSKAGKPEDYNLATQEYFTIAQEMEKENHLMVTNMIGMRNSLNDLVEINREVKKENMALHRKSEIDALTGIFNRFKLNEYSEISFQKAFEQGKSLAIEILDIDHFKQYNDNYGHQAGDLAIKAVAQLLSLFAQREGISCYRYGGDEFVIIYEGFSKEQMQSFAEELKRKIQEKEIPHSYSQVEKILTISQGICWGYPKREEKVWDYLHTADEMLYRVKKDTRNNWKIGQPEEL